MTLLEDELPPIPDAPDDAVALSLEDTVTQLAVVAPAVARTLSDLRTSPISLASPEERLAIVDLYWTLVTLVKPVQDRIKSIEMSWMRAMHEEGATQIPLPDGRIVGYDAPRTEWVVEADAMKRELLELRDAGVITDIDIDKAFTTTVSVKADNRVLNHLAKTRGANVAAVIEGHRRMNEPSPLAGKVRLPQPLP